MVTRRKRKAKKTTKPRSVLALIVLIAFACVVYEPLTALIGDRQATPEIATRGTGTVTAKAVQEDAEGPATSAISEGVSANQEATSAASLSQDDITDLELPAPLTDRPERILKRKSYTTSYNNETRLPNWVAWELTPEKLVERESRTNKFLPDPDLPEAEAVTTDDYKNSGWDRGHMCPAGDNRWHWRAMTESFYMTNICPQHHNLNRGDWKELEEDCRRWAEATGRVYIVCGPILYRQEHQTIGREHQVTVPEAFFKVILCMETTPPRAVGFIYKNASGNHPLDSYVNTVDEVERITGIDFFPALPDEVERVVEASYDLSLWR